MKFLFLNRRRQPRTNWMPVHKPSVVDYFVHDEFSFKTTSDVKEWLKWNNILVLILSFVGAISAFKLITVPGLVEPMLALAHATIAILSFFGVMKLIDRRPSDDPLKKLFECILP